jgi:hypothetical protein
VTSPAGAQDARRQQQHLRADDDPNADSATPRRRGEGGLATVVPYQYDPVKTLYDACGDASHRRRVCGNFAPLWNRNDYCCHCYNPLATHSEDLERRQERLAAIRDAAAAKEALLGGRRIVATTFTRASGRPHMKNPDMQGSVEEVALARFHAIPWHVVLTYAAVPDLLVAGQSCRALALAARPLLHSTMTIVLTYPPPSPSSDLRESVVEIAELLTSDENAALSENVLRLVHLVLATHMKGFNPEANKIATLSDAVTTLRYVVGLRLRQSAKLPADYQEALRRMEAIVAVLSHTAPDTVLIISPLLHFLSSLWRQQKIQVCAARYLSQDFEPL